MNEERQNQKDVSQGPQIRRSGKKRRIHSKRIILVALLAVGVVIAVITTQVHFRKNVSYSEKPEGNYRPPQQGGFTELATSMRRDRQPVQTVKIVQNIVSAEPIEPKTQPQRIVAERRQPVVRPSLPRYYSNKDDAQAAQTLRTLQLQALTSKPVVEDFEGMDSTSTTETAVPAASAGAGAGQNSQNVQIPEVAAIAALMQQQGEQDPNRQTQKQDFLRGTGGGASWTPQGYSQNIPIPRQFDYELKAGTIIPRLLLTGINSDLPGNVLAQVSENVWDVTGKFILIPKGARVIGVYDSEVTFGQQRVLLVWNRLVFPDGTTLNIAGSPGVDRAGYSGLSGRVNEHWGQMFKAALFASVFVAGAEIVYGGEDDSSGGDETKSPRDVAAESLAGSILDMGTKVMDRTSGIQPTITVKPGKKMGIFVQEDIVFPFPYM